MGRIKELRDRLKSGVISAEEKKELKELETEAKEVDVDTKGVKLDDEVEQLSKKMADSISSAIDSKLASLEDLTKSLSEASKTRVETGSETKFIVDPQMGKVAVDKLEDVKVVLTDRKSAGKQNYEVSKKTVHFVQALAAGDRQKLQLLVGGTAASGGYLVPEDFVNIVIEDRRDATIMRQLATVLPVGTDTVHLPNIGTRPRAFWRSEGAVKATTTVTFGEIVLTPYSLAAITGLSNELVADASLGGPIVSLVAKYMGQALAETEDQAFWEGDGSGKPTGVDNYSFTTVDAGAGASDAARADAIIKSLYRLNQGYRNNAVFVANKNTWAKVATLKDTQNNYLLSSLGNSPAPTLRGRPTFEQNDIGDGKMFLGDFSYYYIADRQGITVDVSTEATVASSSAFEKNLTFVRVEERVDGELSLTQPVIELANMGGL